MDFFNTDFHCHILPGIDDGAADLEESLALIKMQMSQGVRNIVATPHYRMHEMSVERFLRRRGAAYKMILESDALENKPTIMLAAEIALEHNLCELQDIHLLGNHEMNTLLIELPYENYRKWMSEEIEEISYKTKMQIIIAHLDRYIDIFSSADYNDILNIPDAIFQFNTSVFSRWKTKKLLKPFIRDDYPVVFGTDCHNTSFRKPNFDLMIKNLRNYEPNYHVMQLLQNK